MRTVVVLDGCQDRTAVIAAASREVQTVAITAASAGAARRAGASAALAGAGPPGELWLANTDADSQVPANWLTGMLTEARLGAHVVLGTVLPGRDLEPRTRAEWLSRHHLRDGHPHVHGANFGIRADAYLSLGGWPPVVTGEDTELARRAARTGHLRISRTASIPVVTSVRPRRPGPAGLLRLPARHRRHDRGSEGLMASQARAGQPDRRSRHRRGGLARLGRAGPPARPGRDALGQRGGRRGPPRRRGARSRRHHRHAGRRRRRGSGWSP